MTENPGQLHPEESKTELAKVAEEQQIKDATRLQLHELLGETESGKTSSSNLNAQNGTGAQKGGVETGSSMGSKLDESVSKEKKEGEGKTTTEPNKPNLPENPQAPHLQSPILGGTASTGTQTGGEVSGTTSGTAGTAGGNIAGGVVSGSHFGF